MNFHQFQIIINTFNECNKHNNLLYHSESGNVCTSMSNYVHLDNYDSSESNGGISYGKYPRIFREFQQQNLKNGKAQFFLLYIHDFIMLTGTVTLWKKLQKCSVCYWSRLYIEFSGYWLDGKSAFTVKLDPHIELATTSSFNPFLFPTCLYSFVGRGLPKAPLSHLKKKYCTISQVRLSGQLFQRLNPQFFKLQIWSLLLD